MKVKRYNSIYRRHVDPLKVVGGILMTVACLGLGILAASLIFGFGREETPEETSSVIESSQLPDLNASSTPIISENEITVSRDGAIRAAFLPTNTLYDENKLAQFINDAKETNITDVIITVKDDTGIIYFDSDYEKAKYINNKAEESQEGNKE